MGLLCGLTGLVHLCKAYSRIDEKGSEGGTG